MLQTSSIIKKLYKFENIDTMYYYYNLWEKIAGESNNPRKVLPLPKIKNGHYLVALLDDSNSDKVISLERYLNASVTSIRDYTDVNFIFENNLDNYKCPLIHLNLQNYGIKWLLTNSKKKVCIAPEN